jgi:hypothetical protein
VGVGRRRRRSGVDEKGRSLNLHSHIHFFVFVTTIVSALADLSGSFLYEQRHEWTGFEHTSKI